MRRRQRQWAKRGGRLRRTLGGIVSLWLVACAPAPQRLEYASYPTEALPRDHMPYAVWAPRDLAPEERLPVVLFLHGGGDGAECFDEAGLGGYLDRALAEGRIPRVVIAVPEGERGFWENWQDGSHDYRDWVVREVLPAVQRRYHTGSCPDDCHVMGVSMGGYGALRFALLEPGRFASVSALSAPIFDTKRMLELRDSFWFGLAVPVEQIWGEDASIEAVRRDDLFLRWRSQEDLGGARLLLSWGSEDREGIVKSNRAFMAHLQRQGIAHRAFEFTGPHKWTAWTPVIARALRVQVR